MNERDHKTLHVQFLLSHDHSLIKCQSDYKGLNKKEYYSYHKRLEFRLSFSVLNEILYTRDLACILYGNW